MISAQLYSRIGLYMLEDIAQLEATMNEFRNDDTCNLDCFLALEKSTADLRFLAESLVNGKIEELQNSLH